MSYRVETIAHFEREAKRLKKKYQSLKEEINGLIDILKRILFKVHRFVTAFIKSGWGFARRAKANGAAQGLSPA
ncbi:hypothetical protein ACAW74_21395 [Fibrella sp. WM1]|uniref:hypothetical protein n=1 Tax=Fibrella musci TaxID=3242485 RepID=UPI0035221055